MKHARRIGVFTAGLALVASTLTALPAQAASWPPPTSDTGLDSAACSALVGAEIPSNEFDLPTTGAIVTAANWVDETGGQCRVNGDILAVDPEASAIKFQVNLPKSWNQRALQFGGGGLNGSLRDATDPYRYQPPGEPTPLQLGFVTLGSDGGHQGTSAEFAYNDEELLNYGKQAIKKTHDVALALIDRAYGAEPLYFYYQGFSTGGAEALDAASLYADDYDGVVAGTPAYNVEMMHLGWGLVAREAIWENDAAGFLTAAKQNLLVDSVYATCDPLDGIADGVVSDTQGCLSAFDIMSLRCADGVDTGDTCLSDPQINAINTLSTPQDLGIEMSGNSVAAEQPYLNGGLLTRGRFNLGTDESVPGGHFWGTGVSNSRYFITKDPTVDFLTFDETQHVPRIQELAQIMDVQVENFQNSYEEKTKVLLYTGLADDGISPYNTIQLYDRIVAELGQDKVDSFMKFYTVPGLSHGFGPFLAGMPTLPALMAWVEDGVEPAGLTAVDTNAATAGRERPVCEYPLWPQFTGADPDDASSFTCVREAIPVNESVPTVSGTADVGKTLTADTGEWNREDFTFSYQWLRAGQPISKATSSAYTVTSKDQGKAVSVRVTATSTDGSNAAESASVTVRHIATVVVSSSPLLVASASKAVMIRVTVFPSTADGPVSVRVAGKTITGTVVNGKAALSAGKLPRGVHVITATYSGDEEVAAGKGYGVIVVLR